ncbi:hypothetical protein BGZ98_000605 [Dissophora globulifera]|nr:hypothetical protein BGZ98_000605 [Dissophora globulifera]
MSLETLAYRYYVDYGLAIRGLVEKHPEIDVGDYNDKVDGALPLERVLKKDPALREMILSMNVGKKWLFTNAGESKAFEKAMREAGAQDPSLCYFVDDSLPNIERASAVGWTAVHVEESLPADAKAGSLRIRSVLDLPSVLPQFWASDA